MGKLFVVVALIIGGLLGWFLFEDIMSGFTAHGVGRDAMLVFGGAALLTLTGAALLRRLYRRRPTP